MIPEIKNNEQVLKSIESGAFRDCYLIYNRKSTDEPNNQKNSIKYQRAENTRCASRERLSIAPISVEGFCGSGIISESHSGYKEDNDVSISDDGVVRFRIERPKFQRLVRFLSRGLFKGVIVLCWDRISRNKGDDTVLRKLMRKGVDVRFAFTKYENTSSGALHMDIDGMFAEHHSRVTSEKVSTATWNLRERGICTYRAPIGYLNTGSMENKPLDPVRAPVIKRMFELYASGDWSLEDMARYAGRHGLTTVPIRRHRTKAEMLAEEEEDIPIERVSRPITANMVHPILTNPFYIGKILGNEGKYVPSASHVGLVPQAVFHDVQCVLNKRKTSIHYTDKLNLFYRGKVRCAMCGRVYMPYVQKGIQYFFSKCVRGCANPKKSFNISFLEAKIGELIATLYFTSQELAEADSRAQTGLASLEQERIAKRDQRERRAKKVHEVLQYLRNNRLTLLQAGVYTPATFVAEETRLDVEMARFQENPPVTDAEIREAINDVVKLSELSLSENTLRYKVKKGFEPFETRFVALGC